MATTLLPNPAVLHLDRIVPEGDRVTLLASARQPTVACPGCGKAAVRVHSRYQRMVTDLPWQGIPVRFVLAVRKFFCDNKECERRIFAETLPQVVQRYARKTVRLADALTELVYLVGGEAAARIARAFGLLVSPDTLLRHLRRLPVASAPTPRVLGVDDFAFRKGQRYGTILVDLERHCPIDLLPDREPESLVKWLHDHTGVEVISRDRGIAYIEGATKGAPNAVQVADRFHLIKNLGDALETFLLRQHDSIRKLARTIATESVEVAEKTGILPPLRDPAPQPLTPAQEQEKQNRRARRHARYEEVTQLASQGLSRHEISRRLGMSRNTIRRFLENGHFPEIAARPPRRSILSPFADYLRQRWKEGECNACALYQEIVARGFAGSPDLVQRFVASWREKPRSRRNGRHPPPLVPTNGHLSFVLMNPEHPRVKAEIRSFAQRLTTEQPAIASAQSLSQEFCRLVRERDREGFAGWLEKVFSGEIAEITGFARGLVQDRAAVEAALSSEWSNGQVEGQVNRLKFLKRSMYGRAGFDLLKARVLPRKAA
jgi:transposase